MALDLSPWVTISFISTPFVAMHDAITKHLFSSELPHETNYVKLPVSRVGDIEESLFSQIKQTR